MSGPSREQKLEIIAEKSSMTAQIYEAGFRASGCKTYEEYNKTLKPGGGKGKEPPPLCGCHKRNPCPIDVQYERIVNEMAARR